jgi:glutamate decarboxylase
VVVQKLQREAGKSFVSRTRIEIEQYDNQPVTVFRVVLANPLTTLDDLQSVLDEQIAIVETHPIWLALNDYVQAKIA